MIVINKQSAADRVKVMAGSYDEDDISDDSCDIIPIPQPLIPRGHARQKHARGRGRLALISVTLTALLTAGSYFGFIWLPNYREAAAERVRQAKWALEELQHPLAYRSLIDGYSQAQGVDPALVAAVILNESSYNPKAESYLGARGLMQLMPETAEWVAHKLRETYNFDALYDPETNIRFGTWFLGYLSGRFEGDPVKMAAGYHAGAGQVDAWLNNPEYTQAGALTVIPFKDTDRYVNKVINAYEVYKRHYYTPAEPLPDGQPGGA